VASHGPSPPPLQAARGSEEAVAYLHARHTLQGAAAPSAEEAECEGESAARRHREYELLDMYTALEAMNERDD
jgi:hypothetical protein